MDLENPQNSIHSEIHILVYSCKSLQLQECGLCLFPHCRVKYMDQIVKNINKCFRVQNSGDKKTFSAICQGIFTIV